jgi:hypothetical protein
MKYVTLLLLMIFPILFGCNGKSFVSGKVTFPDDSPLTQGFVIFETENYQVFGKIDESGSYSMSEIKPGDGILPGTYGVSVQSQTGGTSDGAPLVKYVAQKFESAATSGLTCEVKGNTVFNFTVEKP